VFRPTLTLLVICALAACGSRPAPPAEEQADTATAATPAAAEAPDSVLAPPMPGVAEDPAIQDARDAQDFERRQRSMETEQSCLAKIRDVPPDARATLEAVCRRRR
jgi:hypothetical protein